jgi:UDP-N-acetylglucosamine--N-acetylmuramyl-(pentapeptide) pyrophosphoryl-undecaprenol N-acetylglucosamine transferase
MRKTVIIAVGGTGGHVIPAQKIGKALSLEFNVVYVGVGLLKNNFFQKETNLFHDIEGSGLSKGVISCFKKNMKGIFQAKKLLKEYDPSHVIGFGSFHSFPVLAAALYFKIPYDLFEFNVIPGRVNSLFSKWARKIFIHFEPRGKKLSKNLIKIDYEFEKFKEVSQEEARGFFGLDKDKKTLLVFGGSQGADVINQLMPNVSKEVKEEFQILHFPGKESDFDKIYKNLGVKASVTSFCDRMELAWSAADLAICRAGAGAMREILVFEKPAILIPYPKASDDHQTWNAKYIEDVVKGGILLSEKNLRSEELVKKIRECIKNSNQMKESIKLFKNKEKRPFFSEVNQII